MSKSGGVGSGNQGGGGTTPNGAGASSAIKPEPFDKSTAKLTSITAVTEITSHKAQLIALTDLKSLTRSPAVDSVAQINSLALLAQSEGKEFKPSLVKEKMDTLKPIAPTPTPNVTNNSNDKGIR